MNFINYFVNTIYRNIHLSFVFYIIIYYQVSYDHRSNERSLSGCVWKPEEVGTSMGFEL